MSNKKNDSAFQHDKTDGHDEWLTPPEITTKLGPFDLDPCSPIDRPWPTATKHYTILDNGLAQKWDGFVWCNPPYGREAPKWLEKMAMHNNGISLIFARTDTIAWHKWIFPKATSVCFMAGRITFYKVTGEIGNMGAGAPSALVAYGEEADRRIKEAKMGYYINLGNTQESKQKDVIDTLFE